MSATCAEKFSDGRSTLQSCLDLVKSVHLDMCKPKDVSSAIDSLKVHTPGDAVEIAYELKRLGSYIDASDQFLKQKFIDSCTEYTIKVQAQSFLSMGVYKGDSPSMLDIARYISSLPMPNNAVCHANKFQNVMTNKPNNNSANKSKSILIRCYNCSGNGHTSRDCSSPKFKCGKCGRFGHRDQFCFSTKNSNAVLSEEPPQCSAPTGSVVPQK